MTALQRKLLRWLGVVAAATGLAVGLARTEWHSSLENVYYDYWHLAAGVRYEPKHAAFITVDPSRVTRSP